jgi:outer membrane protein assembly factor BamE (lipoprotein component of BamABCDE complex)
LKSHKKSTILIILLPVLAVVFSGCAAITALKQPSKKNLQVLNPGTQRENVIAYLGAPISSEKENGETIDIYKFRQGYSGGNKATRAFVHLTLDVFTFFIWELIGWPTEVVMDGEDKTVKVTFDQDKRVKDFMYLMQEG